MPSIFRSERLFFKVIWLILLLGSSSACIYYLAICFNGYFEYEYITSIRTIPEKPVDFPAISICSFNNPKFEFTVLTLKINSIILPDGKNHFEPFNDSLYGDCYRLIVVKTILDIMLILSAQLQPAIYLAFILNFMSIMETIVILAILLFTFTIKPTLQEALLIKKYFLTLV